MSFEQQNLPSTPALTPEDKKVSPQSAFMQYAAVPVFALIVYTFSKNMMVALTLVLFFYGNVVALWVTMKLLIPKQRFFDALMVMNLSFMLMGFVFVSFSMASDLSALIKSNAWGQVVVAIGFVYFVLQGAFVRQVTQAVWVKALLVSVLACIANALVFYILISALLAWQG